MRLARTLLPLIGVLPWLCAASDPGLVVELDRERFEVRVRDLRDDRDGPGFRVVIGSPSHPTPAGDFAVHEVVRNPRWDPGETARKRGARPRPASSDGPLGVAKIRFGPEGVALHGGAREVLLGKPISLGCVRARDRDLLALLDWMDRAGALGPRIPVGGGEETQRFQRKVRIVVR